MIISIVFPRTPFLVLVVMMMVVVCCFVPSKGRLFRAMATLCRQKMLSAFSRIRTKKELPNVQPQPIKRLEDLDKKKERHIGASSLPKLHNKFTKLKMQRS